MNDYLYEWRILLHAADAVPELSSDALIHQLNSAILESVERIFSRTGEIQGRLTIAAGTRDAAPQIISIRKTFQITQTARKLSEAKYTTAQEAISGMRACRARAQTGKDTYVVIKDPDGSFAVAQQIWASCEFDTQIEAEDALQGFDDPSTYQIIPVLVFEFDPQ